MKSNPTLKRNFTPALILISVAAIFTLTLILVSSPGLSVSRSAGEQPNGTPAQTTIVEGSRQIAKIKVRGGYSPNTISATANLPLTLQMQTDGTFDCSAAFTIPALQISRMLPLSGLTEIEIPPQKAGSTINGTCTMGMYRLQINYT